MVKENIVAIIPARGGSKRMPKKNIIEFNGKPLIAWTIEAAQKSKLFNRIIVSTDNEEIAEIAMQYGAEVPSLRDSKSDDFSPVSEATIRALEQLEGSGFSFNEVVQLLAVCPLRTANDIRNAYTHFKEKRVPFLVSCFKYTWMNPWWAVTLDDQGQPEWIFKNAKKRSQDLPNLYSPTGAIWIANVKELHLHQTFYGQGHIFWEMDWKRAVDVDTYDDLILAKTLSQFNEG